MFRLTEEEWNNWKSQFVTSNYMSEDEIQAIKMVVRRPPFAFTEQGVSQLSSVLKSDRAIELSECPFYAHNVSFPFQVAVVYYRYSLVLFWNL